MDFAITSDSELKERVYAATSYDDSPDELPDSQLSTILDTAKLRLYQEAGSDNWYSSDGLGLALFAYTAMRAKASVENIPLDSYDLGDEVVEFNTDDPDNSVQLNQWADDVAAGLAAFEEGSDDARVPTNTAGYIGKTYVNDGYTR